MPNAIIDLRYSTPNSIGGKPPVTYDPPRLRRTVALALQHAEQAFEGKGYRLVIWDALRAAATHAQLLQLTHDDRYVRKDSNHLKGLAVDVTLATANGEYLDMGTDFDDFSPRAHLNYGGLTSEQSHNRQILRATLEAAGFTTSPYEWWHFDYAQV